MNEVMKANSILESNYGNVDKAVQLVDLMLRMTNINNIKRIDYWLDVRNILKVIA